MTQTSTVMQKIAELKKLSDDNDKIIENGYMTLETLSDKGMNLVNLIPGNGIATEEQFQEAMEIMRNMEDVKRKISVAKLENQFMETRIMELTKSIAPQDEMEEFINLAAEILKINE